MLAALLLNLPEYVAPVRKKKGSRLKFIPEPDNQATIQRIKQEDEIATEFLITLVTKGFFNGEFKV